MPPDPELVQRWREIQRSAEDEGVPTNATAEYLALACQNLVVLRFVEELIAGLASKSEVQKARVLRVAGGELMELQERLIKAIADAVEPYMGLSGDDDGRQLVDRDELEDLIGRAIVATETEEAQRRAFAGEGRLDDGK
jgi:hypothetical protein